MIEDADELTVWLSCGTLYIDSFERWRLPAVLCASMPLGTNNHSLASIAALRKRQIRILGSTSIGERNAETESPRWSRPRKSHDR